MCFLFFVEFSFGFDRPFYSTALSVSYDGLCLRESCLKGKRERTAQCIIQNAGQ